MKAYLLIFVFMACACNGQNLVVNGDFSLGNSGFATLYGYIATGESQNPGTYGIRSSSADFNPNYAVFGDHTGGGNMMLVDGSAQLNPTVWTETVPVATNTLYVFSCWATASDIYNPPMLHFSVNGTAMGSDIVLSTNAGTWQQFVSTWNSGASATATLSVTDENPQGNIYGNDFALDDFSFAPLLALLTVTATSSNSVVVSWPSPSPGFVLQQTADLATTNWTTSSLSPVDNGTTMSVTISPLSGNLFFRLSAPK